MAKIKNYSKKEFGFEDVRVEEIDGELYLYNEEQFSKPVHVGSLFSKFIGNTVSLKIDGVVPADGSMFE